jgi:hypothetical protein
MCLGMVTFLAVPCSLRAAAPGKQVADSEQATDSKKSRKDSGMVSCDLPKDSSDGLAVFSGTLPDNIE